MGFVTHPLTTLQVVTPKGGVRNTIFSVTFQLPFLVTEGN